ncbi:hypothetical protein FBY13_110107 [Pantoea sp. SJZ147]|jgi:hypothetical protein|nr:hypothetical protein FBY13_110107 [Pantoea sp. SJZ147]
MQRLRNFKFYAARKMADAAADQQARVAALIGSARNAPAQNRIYMSRCGWL